MREFNVINRDGEIMIFNGGDPYRLHGELVVTVRQETINVTTPSDAWERHIPGRRSLDCEFKVEGYVYLDLGDYWVILPSAGIEGGFTAICSSISHAHQHGYSLTELTFRGVSNRCFP